MKLAEFRTSTVKVGKLTVTVRELSAYILAQYREAETIEQKKAATEALVQWAVIEDGKPALSAEEAVLIAQNMRVANAIVSAAFTLTAKEATEEKQADAT